MRAFEGSSTDGWSSHLCAGGLWRDAVCERLGIAAGAAVAPCDAEADCANLVRGCMAPVNPPLQPGGRNLLHVKHDAHWTARTHLVVCFPAGHQYLQSQTHTRLRCQPPQSRVLPTGMQRVLDDLDKEFKAYQDVET